MDVNNMRTKKELEEKRRMILDILFEENTLPDENTVYNIVADIRLIKWMLEPKARKKKEPDKNNEKLQKFGVEDPLGKKEDKYPVQDEQVQEKLKETSKEAQEV